MAFSFYRFVLRSRRATMILGVVFGMVLGGCKEGSFSFGGAPKPTEAVEEQAAPVVTVHAARGPITAAISVASTIEAEKHVTVHAESTGRIIALPIEEGDRVKKGQVLARIKYEAQESGLERAQANLTKAETDYERMQTLLKQQAVSQEELDAARIAYKTAKIDVEDRHREVRNTLVVAPFEGTITERLVTAGGFVSSGQQLFSIIDFETLVARVYVPEKELDRIAVGQPAQVVGKAAKGRKGTGEVRRIAPVVDPTTGTVKVTIGLPPELSGGDQGFLPGMYAEVTLTTERRESALLLAKQAIVHDEEQSFVFVTDGHRVRRAAVEIGLSNSNEVEIVGGMKEGAEVVLIGQSGLKDGALIRRVDENGEPLEPDPTQTSATGDAVAVEKPDPPPTIAGGA